jgi:hypothetical protein
MSDLLPVVCANCGASLHVRAGAAKCAYCGTELRESGSSARAGAPRASEAALLASARWMLFGHGDSGLWFGDRLNDDIEAAVAAVYDEHQEPDEQLVLLADASEDDDATESLALTTRALRFTDPAGDVRSFPWSSLAPDQIQVRGGQVRVGGHVVSAAKYYRGALDVAALLGLARDVLVRPPAEDQLDAPMRALADVLQRLPGGGIEVHPGLRPSQRARAREAFAALLTDEAPPLVLVEDWLDDEWTLRLIITVEGVFWQNEDEEPQGLAWSEIDPSDVGLSDADEDDEDSAWLLQLTDDEDNAVVFQSCAGYLDGLVSFITTFAALAHGEDPAAYLTEDDDDEDDDEDDDADDDADDEEDDDEEDDDAE